MDHFTEFTREMLTYSRFWKKFPVGKGINRGIIVFGHSNIVHLEVILRNILSFLCHPWEMTVITYHECYVETNQLCAYLDPNITVQVHDQYFKEKGVLNQNIYHSELSNLHFWMQFGWDKLVVIHPDCLIIHPKFSEFIEHYDLLNSHFSYQLPKNLADIGNGGLIVRTMNAVKNQTDTICNLQSIPRSIDRFMVYHELYCLPEFYFYERSISNNCFYLCSRSTIQLSSLWVHAPWKIGDNWRDYLARILTPKFNVINVPAMHLFSDNAVNHYNLGIVNIDQKNKPFKYPEFPWYGYIASENNASKNGGSLRDMSDNIKMTIDPRQLTACLGFYTDRPIKDRDSCFPANLVTINQLTGREDWLGGNDYSRKVVYANLARFLEQYTIIGHPFEAITQHFRSDKTELHFIDARLERIRPDFDYKGKKIVLFVNDFNQLNEYLVVKPILVVLPYTLTARDKIKSTINISKYNYFGYYQHVACLFMGPYSDLTMSAIHQIIIDKNQQVQAPFYVKQKEEQIDRGYLPSKILEILVSGSMILTNNPQVCDYFDDKVLIVNDFLTKQRSYRSNSWTDLMYHVKNNYSLEHRLQIILSVVSLLLSPPPTNQDSARPGQKLTNLAASTNAANMLTFADGVMDDKINNGRPTNSQQLRIYNQHRNLQTRSLQTHPLYSQTTMRTNGRVNKNGLYAAISQASGQASVTSSRLFGLTRRPNALFAQNKQIQQKLKQVRNLEMNTNRSDMATETAASTVINKMATNNATILTNASILKSKKTKIMPTIIRSVNPKYSNNFGYPLKNKFDENQNENENENENNRLGLGNELDLEPPVSINFNHQLKTKQPFRASSLRFGGFNDKVTHQLPMTRRRLTRVSLQSYQTISNTRW